MTEATHSVATRTLRGMAWAYGAYVGGRLLVLVSTAILARVLTPADFGVVALAMTFMVFLDAVRDLGLAQAVIVSRPEDHADRAQTAFSWSVLIGLALTLLTAAAAPLAADFFRQPQLTELLPVLGTVFLIRSLGSTHYAIARKDLNYRVRTVSEMCEVIVRGVVGIALALAGAGAWSLVAGFVAGAVVSTIVLWLLVPYRPRARLSRVHLKDMLTFGGMLTIVDIGAVLAYNLDYLFIGRLLGATALGLYSIAFRLPELIVVNLATVAGDVLFPAYAAIDKERLREAYVVALRYTAMLTFPFAAGLILLAEPAVHVLFGDQWSDSVEVMQVLTLYAVATTLAIPAGTVYKVTGRAWIMVAFTVPGLVILVGLLAIFADRGIVAVAICTAAMPIVALPITAWIASHQLGLPMRGNLTALMPALLGAAAMVAVLFPLERAITEPLLALIAGTVAGAVAYLGTLLLVARDDLRRLRDTALPRLSAS